MKLPKIHHLFIIGLIIGPIAGFFINNNIKTVEIQDLNDQIKFKENQNKDLLDEIRGVEVELNKTLDSRLSWVAKYRSLVKRYDDIVVELNKTSILKSLFMAERNKLADDLRVQKKLYREVQQERKWKVLTALVPDVSDNGRVRVLEGRVTVPDNDVKISHVHSSGVYEYFEISFSRLKEDNTKVELWHDSELENPPMNLSLKYEEATFYGNAIPDQEYVIKITAKIRDDIMIGVQNGTSILDVGARVNKNAVFIGKIIISIPD